jgi:hypothetical protein
MSGMTYTDQSHKAGLRYLVAGNGSPQDWSVHRSRKRRVCAHRGAQDSRLHFPCETPVIEPGDWYVETRQSLFDSDALSVPCAIRANVYERA